MKNKLTALMLAMLILAQTLVPGAAWAAKDKPKPKSTQSIVKVGELDTKSYPKLDNKTILAIQKQARENQKRQKRTKGSGLFSADNPYLPGQNLTDQEKAVAYGKVHVNFKTTGLNDNGTEKEFQWKEIFGVDSNGNPTNAKIHFIQRDAKTKKELGRYTLLVDKGGEYKWIDTFGKEALLPLYSNTLEPYEYDAALDYQLTDKVKLLTMELGTTNEKSTFKKDEEGRNVATIPLKLELGQVASTKFESEWKASLDENSRPQVEGLFDTKNKDLEGVEIENLIAFPKNDTDFIQLRNNNYDPDNPPNLPYDQGTAGEFRNVPEVRVVQGIKYANEDDFDGTPTYNIDGANKIITSLEDSSIKYKFKYDLQYDVINGGKLTMTEILPVTFDANGGKFASITGEGKEQKIIKEVDYSKDLTDEVETPKKDLESFKGWATEANGKPLSEEAFKAAIKNITEAKTFYAIWDNNPITAEELIVHESFKADGATEYTNDFIPTLADLKKQVTIADANGAPKALTDDDTLQILDDSGEPITDEALKDALYEKLKEDPATEVSRLVTLKAKVTHQNGTSQTVDIPLKVIKNIYEAKTKEGKPTYVPEKYVKVTVNPTTKAEKPQKYFYYVNPKAKVLIPGNNPTGTGDNKFIKWTMKADDAAADVKGEDYKLTDRHQFEKASTITAQYSADVVPQEGENKPEGVPDGFVEVKFVATEKATDATKAEQIFWVNPEKEVTIPVKDPMGKDTNTFKEWKLGVAADGDVYKPGTAKKFEQATTITASYVNDVVEQKDGNKPTEVPDSYVKVTVKLTDKAVVKDNQNNDLTGEAYTKAITRTFWVNPKKEVTLPVAKPTGKNVPVDKTNPKAYKWDFTKWASDEKPVRTWSDDVDTGITATFPVATVITADYDKNVSDQGAVVAKEISVSESHKDESGNWVNNFIPTEEALKALVQVKGTDGNVKDLTSEDTVELVLGEKAPNEKYGSLAEELYDKLQEKNDGDKPFRMETVKAKVTFKNGEVQTVDIPIKVMKNIYESKTLGLKPVYVPNNYVKVTLDPTTKAQNPQKTYYYVNPAAKVVIPGTDPKGAGDNKFIKWTMKADDAEAAVKGEDYKLTDRHKFEKASTITAQYVSDVIPQEGDTKPSYVPENFVSVTFDPTDNGTLDGAKVFWVNPEKEVTIPVKDAAGKEGFTFKGWKIEDGSYKPTEKKKFTANTTVAASYDQAGLIIPYDPSSPLTKPEGYIRVSYQAEEGLTLSNVKFYYVKKNAKDANGKSLTLADLEKPSYSADTGYTFKEWYPEKDAIKEIDLTVVARANKLDPVIRATDSNGNPNKKPDGYKEVTFVVKADDTAKGSIEGVKKFYVNPKEYVKIVPPTTTANTGYEFGAWDKDVRIPTVYTEDTTVTASFNEAGNASANPTPGKTEVKVIFRLQGEGGGTALNSTNTYYVTPGKEVSLNPPKVIVETGYEFQGWTPDATVKTSYNADTIVTGTFKPLPAIVDGSQAKPDGYVRVEFRKGEHGMLEGQTVYYVNPKAKKTFGDLTKPTVKPNPGYQHTGWTFKDTVEIKSPYISVAEYKEIPPVVPQFNDQGQANTKPAGYIDVKFSTETNGIIKGKESATDPSQKTTKLVYVNPNKAVVLKDFAPTVKPNTGYDFADWDTQIDKRIQYSNGDTIKALYNKKGTVIPQTKTDGSDKPAGYFTVTFAKGDHGELSGKTVYYVNPNESVTVPAPKVTAETGWKQKDGTDAWDKQLTQKFAGDTTITAEYSPLEDKIPQENSDGSDKPNGYKVVKFVGVHGSLSEPTVYYVNPNKKVDFTNTVKEFTKTPDFAYTEVDGTWSEEIKAQKFDADKTFTFTFKALDNVIPEKENGTTNTQPKGYVKVEFIAGDHGSLEGGDKTYYVNPTKDIKVGSKDLPIPKTAPKDNYKFDKWLENIDQNEVITTDKKYVATFKINKATMTYDANGATEGTAPEALSYDIGTEITIAGGNNLKKDNAVLTGWNIGNKTYKPGEKFKIEADTTATAVWGAGLHTVNFDTAGGTHIDSQQVKHEALIKPVDAPKKDGYFFTGWTLKGQPFNPVQDKVTEDITLVAQYSKDIIPQEGDKIPEEVPKNFVLVEFKPGTNGTLAGTTKYWVNPIAGIKLSNIAHPSVTANEGWKHTGWDKDDTTTITGAIEVTAQYLEKVLTDEPTENKNKYVTVEFKQGEHGTLVNSDTAKYWVLKDTEVELKAPGVTSATGYAQKSGDEAWSPQIAKSYSTDIEHVAQYDYNGKDVIGPNPDGTKPDTVPDNFVLVEFKSGSQGTIAPTEIVKYWVNPKALVTLPAPRVTPNAGYEQQKGFNAWDHYLRDIFDKETVITAQYEKERGDLGGDWQTGTLGSTRILTVVEKEVVKVPAEKTFRKEVRYMQGFNNYFRPTEGLTRAEAAQILANALVEDGYRYDPNFTIRYKDIVGNEWYAKAIRITSQANVFKGYDTGYFDPHKKITRAEWIGTLRRFQELERAPGNHMQVRPDHWAMGEIEAAYKEGWLAIYGQGLARFNADEFIPRQEVAAVSNKAFNRVLDKTYIHRNSKNLINYKDVNPSMWSYEDILCASNGYLHDGKSFWGHKIDYKKDLYNINLDGYTVTKDKFQRLERR